MTFNPRWIALFLVAMAALASSAEAAVSDTALSVFDSASDHSIGASVLAILAIGMGFVVCIAGYWLIRGVFFVCGFLVGGIGIALVIEHIFQDESWMEMASWIGFVLGGLFVGLAILSLYSLSVFTAGAVGGVVLAIAVHALIGYRIDSDQDFNLLFLILVLVLGIGGGVLALVLEKPLLIISTSLIGAVALGWGIGYFAGNFPTIPQLLHTTSDDNTDTNASSAPPEWWAYLAGMVAFFLIGMAVQFHKTRRLYKEYPRPTPFRLPALRPILAPPCSYQPPMPSRANRHGNARNCPIV